MPAMMNTSTAAAAALPGTLRRITAGLLALVLLFCLAACDRAELELADGSRASFSDWDGRTLVINYWAEWCAPCREEIPELNRLHRDGVRDGLVVLGVNFDGIGGAGLKKLIDQFAIEYPILLADPGPRWQQARPSILPTTLIIRPDGTLQDVLVGPQSYESLRDALGLPFDPAAVEPGAGDDAIDAPDSPAPLPSADEGGDPEFRNVLAAR